jgi:hypothetical protein
MKRIAWISVIATAGCILLYQIKALSIFFTLAVTAGTIAYHFIYMIPNPRQKGNRDIKFQFIEPMAR